MHEKISPINLNLLTEKLPGPSVLTQKLGVSLVKNNTYTAVMEIFINKIQMSSEHFPRTFFPYISASNLISICSF